MMLSCIPQSLVPDVTSFWPMSKPIQSKWANDYEAAQLQVFYRTSNGVNVLRGFWDIGSAKSGFQMSLSCIMSLKIILSILWGRDKMAGLFADNIFKRIFLKEDWWISINIWLQIVPRGPFNNIPSLVQIMAWRWTGDKPLFELIIV